MTILRFLLEDHFGPADQTCDWAHYSDQSELVVQGRGTPASWPTAERYQGIVAATRARVLRLSLPDLPPIKFQSALAYAVETRIADDPRNQYLVAGERQADGKRQVIVIERTWLDTTQETLARAGIAPLELYAQAQLPEAGGDRWWWYRAHQGGFLLLDDDCLPLDEAGSETQVPATLLLALERSGAARPRVLTIAGEAPTPEQELAWVRNLGLTIEWNGAGDWQHVSAARLEHALALSTSASAIAPKSDPSAAKRLLQMAAAVFAVAVSLEITATLVDFARLRWRQAQLEQEAQTLLQQRFPGSPVQTSAFAAFRREQTRALHAVGVAAPNDALPMLARAAPALTLLPNDGLRQAHYASGRWTLELAALSIEHRRGFIHALGELGFKAIYAEQDNGLRVLFEEADP